MHWRGRMISGFVSLFAGAYLFFFSNTLAAQDAHTPPNPAEGLRLVIDSLYVNDGILRVDFHADSAVTVKLLEGLRRGLTAAITYHVQVWQKRWLSDLVAERRLEWKASFDNWERKYIVAGLDERRLTSSVATVREKWSVQRGLRLVDASRLQPEKNYFIVIEAFLEPVSKENLREIRGWLAGEIKSATGSSPQADTSAATDYRTDSTGRTTEAAVDSSAEKSGIKLRILETVMNLIGFGGKKTSARSEIFQVRENTILWQR